MPYFLLYFKMTLTLPAPVPLGLVWFGSEPCAHFLHFSCLAAGRAVGVGTGDTRHLLVPIRCLLCPACHSLPILHRWEAARASLLRCWAVPGGLGPPGPLGPEIRNSLYLLPLTGRLFHRLAYLPE